MTVKTYSHYRDWPMDEWPWSDFSPREMASKREGALKLDTNAMDRLQALRTRLGRPLLITSAYRSPAHNRAVGGAKNSYHMQGVAFDVRMENHDPAEFEAAARAEGFTGFGFYPRSGFMHIDTGPERTWGNRWKDTETRLPVEPPRQPEKLSENRRAQAAGGIAVASAGVGLADQVTREGGIVDRLQDPSVLLIVVIGVAAWLFWQSWRG
jgi:hypothetical protein